MSTYRDLQRDAPVIADRLGAKLASTGLGFLATTRRDGWPRVSPMEVSIIDGRLYVGSMPNAVKARDLQRDPRCCLITPLADKDDLSGEVKAFCRAREITDAEEWERVRATWKEAMDLDIGDPGGSHVFELELVAAAFQRVEGDEWRTTSWRVGDRVRERTRRGPLGESEELPVAG
ncbi:MAG: pyridoxamine 5'-phosphate oxidase family protein [Acidimicrobiia bacterium]|jgi:nitroimidazol reductase NimA-like FMN-containing flavoprotein (pyridoxamine 5'-phosphate oxidase superfamily)